MFQKVQSIWVLKISYDPNYKKLFGIIFISARFQTNGKKLWEYQPRIIIVMFLPHKGNFRKYYHCVDGVSLPSRMYIIPFVNTNSSIVMTVNVNIKIIIFFECFNTTL
jgi:hypothetical protein